ncbi:MAG: efflux RND transporter permease subunit [Acidobacteriota bacterium]
MKIAKLTINRPVTTFMFFLAVVLLGFVSLRELSVDLLPDISYPKLSVSARYPGVAPEEVETLLTQRLESAVMRIPGLRRVETVSEEGGVYMTLEFSWGTDMDFAMLHTREKLDSVRLPEQVENPTIIPLDPQSKPIMVLSVSGDRSLLELKEFSEELIKPRLEQIEGIGSAEIAGGVEREIQVEVNPDLMVLYGLDIQTISNRITQFNTNLQGGTIRKGRFKYALRILGEFEEIDEIGEVSLKTTKEKGVVRVKDIAQIKDSIKEREGITRLNGSESIGILVRKEAGANTVKVTQSAREVIEEIKRRNEQIDIFVVSEQAKYIENAISSVLNAIIYGAVLAFLVLVVFLQDIKTPLIIASVIPIAIIATFNLLFFMNVTLNIMSLGGLALGVGMLVDNSIVVSESIFRHKNLGKSLNEAAYIGTKEVGMAVTASTFTTVSVFLPVIYVHGVAGQLFKDQALTVTFALFSSLIVSLSLLPMLASRKFDIKVKELQKSKDIKTETPQPKQKKSFKQILFLPFKLLQKGLYLIVKVIFMGLNFIISFLIQFLVLVFHYLSLPFKPITRFVFRIYNDIYSRFSSFYHRFLIWALDHKGRIISGSLAFLLITLFLATQIPSELMPKPETSSFDLHFTTPIDYSLEQTSELTYSVEQWLNQQENVVDSFSQIGIVSGMESLNPEVSLNSVQTRIQVQSPSKMEKTIEDLRKFLSHFPDLQFSIVKEQSTIGEFLAFTTAEVGLKIKGEDLNFLKKLSENVIQKLGEIEEITDVTTNIGEGKPEFLVQIKKQSLDKYNISPHEIGSFLVNAVRGVVDTQFKELEKKYDIRIRFQDQTRENIEVLLDEQIPYSEGTIPIRELVTYQLAKGPKEIRRENQEREILVTANARNIKISQAVPLIKEKLDQLEIPKNYRVVFSGEQEEMQKSFRSLGFAFLLAVVLVYMIMAAQFESLLHPLLILFTLPMGLTGVIWALLITGQTLNVISIIGMVVLAGIVVNDAIVKIDYTNQLRKKGMGIRQAIMEASRVRLRPILMTTVSTAAGLFPMSLGLGRGSELQQPLAISVIGGLILATFLTLILIPVAYEITEKAKSKSNK